MKNIIQCMMVFIIFVSVSAREYIYPVGASSSSSDPAFIYVIHQKAVDDVELFAWDPSTGVAYSLLHALYMPLGVSIFPDNSGFSFIDKGRIRIKKFNRRSPKTIDLYDSVYDPAGVVWIDQYNGYFYGKKRDTYGIFHLSSEGDMYPVVLDEAYDCMYPQKIGDTIFYIRRSLVSPGEYQYCIVKGDYPLRRFSGKALFNDTEQFGERVREIIDAQEYVLHAGDHVDHNESVVLDFGNRPIAFLSMVNENYGFFIEHDLYINRQSLYMTYTCHEIVQKDGSWVTAPLFSYQLPTNLLFDAAHRLLELRAALVPYYHNKAIYFSDCLGESDHLHNFQYTHQLGVIKVPLSSQSSSRESFAPVSFKGDLFYGGVCEEDTLPEVADGDMFLDLLTVPDKC